LRLILKRCGKIHILLKPILAVTISAYLSTGIDKYNPNSQESGFEIHGYTLTQVHFVNEISLIVRN
jgi:hypothetical protein